MGLGIRYFIGRLIGHEYSNEYVADMEYDLEMRLRETRRDAIMLRGRLAVLETGDAAQQRAAAADTNAIATAEINAQLRLDIEHLRHEVSLGVEGQRRQARVIMDRNQEIERLRGAGAQHHAGPRCDGDCEDCTGVVEYSKKMADERDQAIAARDAARAGFDRERKVARLLREEIANLRAVDDGESDDPGILKKRLKHEASRANDLMASCNHQNSEIKRLKARFENDQTTIQNIRDDASRERDRAVTLMAVARRPLTDAECEQVVLPKTADFEDAEDYIRALQKAINDVTGKRVQ